MPCNIDPILPISRPAQHLPGSMSLHMVTTSRSRPQLPPHQPPQSPRHPWCNIASRANTASSALLHMQMGFGIFGAAWALPTGALSVKQGGGISTLHISEICRSEGLRYRCFGDEGFGARGWGWVAHVGRLVL